MSEPPLIPSRTGRVGLSQTVSGISSDIQPGAPPPIPSRATKPDLLPQNATTATVTQTKGSNKPFSFKKTVNAFMKDVQELVDTQIVVPIAQTQAAQQNSTSISPCIQSKHPTLVKEGNQSTHTLGEQAVQLSNQFRAENDLNETLEWCEELYELCLEHSINMSAKTVPFGHEGFVERVKRLSYRSKKSAENVFQGSGPIEKLPTLAVDGWINSPGHRANLLGSFNRCAVAFHQADGRWFATQMFTRV